MAAIERNEEKSEESLRSECKVGKKTSEMTNNHDTPHLFTSTQTGVWDTDANTHAGRRAPGRTHKLEKKLAPMISEYKKEKLYSTTQ